MFQPSRLILQAAFLVALSLTSTLSFGREQSANPRGDVDPKSGMRFPARAGAFERRCGIDASGDRHTNTGVQVVAGDVERAPAKSCSARKIFFATWDFPSIFAAHRIRRVTVYYAAGRVFLSPGTRGFLAALCLEKMPT